MSLPQVTQPPGKLVGRLLEPDAGGLYVLIAVYPHTVILELLEEPQRRVSSEQDP